MRCIRTEKMRTNRTFNFKDERGSVAIIFALALMPIVFAVGAAMDYSRGSSAKSSMQAALDGVALNMAREVTSMSDDQITSRAVHMFKAMFNRQEAQGIQVTSQYDAKESTLRLNSTAAIPATLMEILGIDTISISAVSKVRMNSESSGVCVIALDPSTKHSFRVSGRGSANVPNCGVYVVVREQSISV
jgi:Flp pilus assembly protein TadG